MTHETQQAGTPLSTDLVCLSDDTAALEEIIAQSRLALARVEALIEARRRHLAVTLELK